MGEWYEVGYGWYFRMEFGCLVMIDIIGKAGASDLGITGWRTASGIVLR